MRGDIQLVEPVFIFFNGAEKFGSEFANSFAFVIGLLATKSQSCSDETSDEAKEENSDDIPNMQLAWEMLELAKVLYSK